MFHIVESMTSLCEKQKAYAEDQSQDSQPRTENNKAGKRFRLQRMRELTGGGAMAGVVQRREQRQALGGWMVATEGGLRAEGAGGAAAAGCGAK
ncbi:hypothetical protein U1Q18_001192 [Sarracenia purpurea var. burkii]